MNDPLYLPSRTSAKRRLAVLDTHMGYCNVRGHRRPTRPRVEPGGRYRSTPLETFAALGIAPPDALSPRKRTQRMFTLQRIETHTQEIKKSRFLAICGPVSDEQAARDFIAAHSDLTASHNCWAFRIGQTYRFNDDGEPSGTAGKPILQAIDGQSLDHIAVVVIRWFGGTLLGSGGLIRAYGGTAAMCLRAAEKMEVIETVRGNVVCDFSGLALIRARLGGLGVTISAEVFTGTGASLALQIPKDASEAASAIVLDLSRGRAVLTLED